MALPQIEPQEILVLLLKPDFKDGPSCIWEVVHVQAWPANLCCKLLCRFSISKAQISSIRRGCTCQLLHCTRSMQAAASSHLNACIRDPIEFLQLQGGTGGRLYSPSNWCVMLCCCTVMSLHVIPRKHVGWKPSAGHVPVHCDVCAATLPLVMRFEMAAHMPLCTPNSSLCNSLPVLRSPICGFC